MTLPQILDALTSLQRELVTLRDGGLDVAGEAAHHVALARVAASKGLPPEPAPVVVAGDEPAGVA